MPFLKAQQKSTPSLPPLPSKLLFSPPSKVLSVKCEIHVQDILNRKVEHQRCVVLHNKPKSVCRKNRDKIWACYSADESTGSFPVFRLCKTAALNATRFFCFCSPPPSTHHDPKPYDTGETTQTRLPSSLNFPILSVTDAIDDDDEEVAEQQRVAATQQQHTHGASSCWCKQQLIATNLSPSPTFRRGNVKGSISIVLLT
ncbi:Hypothetical protein, putative [Bodo saltans]|uniref:Uncharacterized protein n=1 Tax=Bodo saltans TaxID=75058 RepID=A0A0S4JMR0_BODSA|nr:Hypothetical protein, putative [Bodo saltans]|eukprot:CUG92787.1 Hypothetical protein, putative [Bodo saltans]